MYLPEAPIRAALTSDWRSENPPIKTDEGSWFYTSHFTSGLPQGFGDYHEGEPFGDDQTVVGVLRRDTRPIAYAFMLWVRGGEPVGIVTSSGVEYYVDQHVDLIVLHENANLLVGNVPLAVDIVDQNARIAVGPSGSGFPYPAGPYATERVLTEIDGTAATYGTDSLGYNGGTYKLRAAPVVHFFY